MPFIAPKIYINHVETLVLFINKLEAAKRRQLIYLSIKSLRKKASLESKFYESRKNDFLDTLSHELSPFLTCKAHAISY